MPPSKGQNEDGPEDEADHRPDQMMFTGQLGHDLADQGRQDDAGREVLDARHEPRPRRADHRDDRPDDGSQHGQRHELRCGDDEVEVHGHPFLTVR
ncbi:hypothetical protein [Propioniciclava tarda]|uniref:hypothetical protein n=1 Tax=Propioniciclava tarda TaxID=433330 RepID=UPI0019D5F88D|nr:hypothetical protein [Propioniciclava tarda]